MSATNGTAAGEPTILESPVQSDPPPALPVAKKTPHPFFMTTLEKKKQMQEAAAVAEAQKAQAPIPSEEYEREQQESTAATTTKPKRATRKPKRQPKRKAKQDTDPPPPPSSSQAIDLPSIRTEIDPITAAAAPPLTPSTSAPSPSPSDNEVDADIDPNAARSKRRRQEGSPLLSYGALVDKETGAILRSSPTRRSGLSITRDGCLIKIKADKDVAHRLLPSSPVLPAFQLGEPMQLDSPGPSTPGSSASRLRATYDKGTSILSIRNSPGPSLKSSPPPQELPRAPPSSPPQQPVRRNAFALLGKKKEPEKPAPKKSKAKKEETSDFEDTAQTSPSNQGKNKALKTKDAVPTNPKQAPKESATTDKAVHPFFSAAGRKQIQRPAPISLGEGGTKKTVSPPRRSPNRLRAPKPSFGGFMPAFGASAADRAAKIPGMMEPAWPIKGASHVRGEETPDGFRSMDIIVGFGGQKLKDARILITPEEDILVSIARKLHIDNIIADIRSDDYHERKHFDVPAEIRLPQRLIATGSQLQEMIRPRIAARLPHPQALSQQMEEVDSDSESAAHMTITATGVHRALLRLYERLGTELTAFDMHKCDASPWEVKYAPETIGEILQLGREAGVIKEWLTGLRTDKVHTGCTKGKRKAKPKASASKKRRKKGGDMDGFLVDSEEERGIMNEIAEASPEEIDWLNPVAKTKKSTIRTGGKMAELLGKKKDKTNTIVISGPTGCGKTAAVYAAAKELGYTVFEVNSGMRRSGKDVIDMVGDMSRNHQVGNQSVMESDNPFSKAKAAKSAAVAIEDDLQMRQRQSLILFEEVDILFEEDKSFWITVIGLMAQSKRPIVLTCNNETLLPWDDLTLHAVLRFSLPPRDLLVDHLLLMAANEGHLLQRPAVDALVQAKSNDLRACIMELQFHCRMAVGDRKGGLDWWIHRFPAGCDIAENGEKNRVISVDTYTLGMGMIPNVPDLNEDDKWRGLWDEYGLDIGASVNGLEDYARAMEEAGVDKQVSLRITDAFFEARSAADAFAPLEASSLDQPRLDFTLPKRKKNPKLVLDDLYGIKILQTDPSTIPTAETELAICMRSLAREYVSSVAKKFSVDLKPMDNAFLLDAIVTRNVPEGITRMTMQNLFAPLSKAETMFASTPATLHSSIYPSLTMLTVGIAPWVRNILRRDIAMEKERRKASNLLSMGGKRRTRAARLAVEGGDRMRKERHFRALGADVVACSAGEDWEHAVEYEQERRRREMVNNV